MQLTDSGLVCSPSDLNHFVECEHLTALDLLAIEGNGVAKEKDPQAEILRAKGFEHEQAWLRHLRDEGREIVEIAVNGNADWHRDAERTVAAMCNGAEVIYQAVFVAGDWRGIADFLIRVDRASQLGPWSYEACDAKLSSRSFVDEWAQSAEGNAPNIAELAATASSASREPRAFRAFIERVLAVLPAADEEHSDLAEDLAAWRDLNRTIGQAVGRDAPLEIFLQELGLRSKEPPVGPGTVTLMTIHGAKGKEFDHVYLVGAAEDILPSFQSLKAGAASFQMEEERRNCFVAITRARECLSVSFADRYKGWKKSPSRFLKEMGVEVPLACE